MGIDSDIYEKNNFYDNYNDTIDYGSGFNEINEPPAGSNKMRVDFGQLRPENTGETNFNSIKNDYSTNSNSKNDYNPNKEGIDTITGEEETNTSDASFESN